MIDLHIHTKFSDGADSLKTVINKANALNLEAISITDHNKCKAFLFKNKCVLKKFRGKVITGCEFTVSYKQGIIEILAYSFNTKQISEFIKNNYPSFKEDKFRRLNLTIAKLNESKIEFNKKRLVKNVKRGSTSSAILHEMLASHKNTMFLNGKTPDKREFLRHYLNNPNHALYINYSVLYPSVKEVIDSVHLAGGLCFLAHAYEYSLDIEKELDALIKLGLDGLECYYPAFTKEQTKSLEEFCSKNKLLKSGGSDYHGENRSENKLATGSKNNLNISLSEVDWVNKVRAANK